MNIDTKAPTGEQYPEHNQLLIAADTEQQQGCSAVVPSSPVKVEIQLDAQEAQSTN